MWGFHILWLWVIRMGPGSLLAVKVMKGDSILRNFNRSNQILTDQKVLENAIFVKKKCLI